MRSQWVSVGTVMLGVMAVILVSGIGVVAAGQESVPTFTKDVAPILYENCVRCHRPGEVAPMSLTSYQEARPWARSIKAKVAAREMPPWFADPAFGSFRNDARLTQDEIDTIGAWADAGAPEGNDADLPAMPQFAAGWLHPSGAAPDAVIEMPLEFAVGANDGEIPMKGFFTPVPFEEDRFVEAVQAVPGNRPLVHHIVMFAQTLPPDIELIASELPQRPSRGGPDDAQAAQNEQAAQAGTGPQFVFGSGETLWLGVYAPGWLFEQYRPGIGKRIRKDDYIHFNVHYQATGRDETDRSKVGLWFQDTLQRELVTHRVGETHIVEGRELVGATERGARVPNIPPHVADWGITGITPIPNDVSLHAFAPHMHLRGKSMKYVVTYPDGRQETLLSVPKYDFNWQLFYELEEPIVLPAGSTIRTVSTFDNSINNRYNPAPDQEVYWAEQSWDEMFLGLMFYTVDEQSEKDTTE